MVDIHTHVLPRIDDGPEKLEDSIDLIKTLVDSGVTDIVSTSHYYSESISFDSFIGRRARRLDEVRQAIKEHNIPVNIISGAEVNISKLLLNLDSLKDLCFENTNRILLEIPHNETNLEKALDLIEKIISYYNVVPIVAHVERYSFFSKKIKNLNYLKEMGCTLQVDAHCLFERFGQKRFVLKAIDEGLVDVVASDCHDTNTRPPNLADAYAVISKKLGDGVVQTLKDNAAQLIK